MQNGGEIFAKKVSVSINFNDFLNCEIVPNLVFRLTGLEYQPRFVHNGDHPILNNSISSSFPVLGFKEAPPPPLFAPVHRVDLYRVTHTVPVYLHTIN